MASCWIAVTYQDNCSAFWSRWSHDMGDDISWIRTGKRWLFINSQLYYILLCFIIWLALQCMFGKGSIYILYIDLPLPTQKNNSQRVTFQQSIFGSGLVRCRSSQLLLLFVRMLPERMVEIWQPATFQTLAEAKMESGTWHQLHDIHLQASWGRQIKVVKICLGHHIRASATVEQSQFLNKKCVAVQRQKSNQKECRRVDSAPAIPKAEETG
jgi:hypothetical protein